jgi:hypothetical protein
MEQRIGVVGCRLHLGGIGFGKEVGANGDVGARVEELFWLEVKSSCIFGADLEESDRDGDAVLEKPAHPEDSLMFGVRLSGKLDCMVVESNHSGDLLRAVDADRVGMKVGLRCCDGKHGIERRVWSAAFEQNDHLVL